MKIMQTKAIFVDAYRELNAKKLFWISIALSSLLVLLFAAIGYNDDGVSFLWMSIGFLPINPSILSREFFYLQILFTSLGIQLWLTWVISILALVSTSSIIPDLISSGTIETTLSKPISRTRLFLSKYCTGLMFVGLQVGVFSLGSFLAIGLRGGVWEPGIFLAIPIVLAFFSFLFSISATIGLITRAAMPALLVTCLIWSVIFLMNLADGTLLMFKINSEILVEQRVERIEEIKSNTQRLIRSEMNREEPGSGDNYVPKEDEIAERNPFMTSIRDGLEDDQQDLDQLTFWHNLVFGVKTVLPKTGETTDLLSRYLVDPSKYPEQDDDFEEPEDPNEFVINQNETQKRMQEELSSRSLVWILGTSFMFEGALLIFCLWRFNRRDF
jgi:ABC-type transport system involved in multi-copper enzyme maturation permease subunit